MIPRHWLIPCLLLATLVSSPAQAELWQFTHPFTYTHSNGSERSAEAHLWVPDNCEGIRGVLLLTHISNEMNIASDPQIREVLAANNLGIIYFFPGYGATFDYWRSDVEVVYQEVFTALADLSGYPEIEHCAWITFGHSTGGIYARNIGYWSPERTIAMIMHKSGNLDQVDILPTGLTFPNDFPNVPLLVVNGQFEEYGPTGINPSDGVTTWEIQWLAARDTIYQLRDVGRPVSNLVEPGAGHMAFNPKVSDFLALYIQKVADYRLPPDAIATDGPINLIPVVEADGWLTEAVPGQTPTHARAAYADYTGPKDEAFWHFDEELAQAWEAFHAGEMDLLDQMLRFNNASSQHDRDNLRTSAFLDDRLTFTVSARYLDAYPSSHPNANDEDPGNDAMGNSGNPIQIRVMRGPVEFVSETDGVYTFRIKPNTYGIINNNLDIRMLASVNAGNGYRYTDRMARLSVRRTTSGTPESITFEPLTDFDDAGTPQTLTASAASGYDVDFYVKKGPAIIEDGQVKLSKVPVCAKFPIDITVRAALWRVSTGGRVHAESEVSQTIQLLAPPLVAVPLAMDTVGITDGQLTIRWTGGEPPFTIQTSPSLTAESWNFLMETSEREATIAEPSEERQFFRVLETPDAL